ncbi:hypothetical protein ACFPPD_19045 [Cohnella suwonensis]|uniref:Flagellar protein FliT n=1 Tax=Cohnella suwonensis TaxID=696072 RepID=A0ABW0LY33_9BACL
MNDSERSHSTYARKWMDDHLDMYNMALLLGDSEWQDRLLKKMADREKLIAKELRVIAHAEVLRNFESLNKDLLNLYEQMRVSSDKEELIALRDRIWELRALRMDVYKKLLAASIPPNERNSANA